MKPTCSYWISESGRLLLPLDSKFHEPVNFLIRLVEVVFLLSTAKRVLIQVLGMHAILLIVFIKLYNI